jgi:glycosyltransferase involved in cell wall biosynthesis
MDGKINVTFVGRVAPNKGFRNLIYTAHYFKRIFNTPVRFSFVGGVDPRLNGFFAEMNKLVQDLGVADIVEFTGRVPVSEIKAFYLASHVFLLTSEHEGFCVPILEAQFFKVPIVAVASTAIPQTLGDNQLLYPAVDFHVLASAIDIISRDPAVKLFLTAAGSRNFLKYETATLRRQFAAHLEALS